MAGKRRLICGKGINDADYIVKILDFNGKGNKRNVVWVCPYYERWRALIARTCGENFKSKNESYIDCTICDEWLIFSNFKEWMEQQDWEGNQLDKDLLIKGNKHYSPETCVFISSRTNSFITELKSTNGPHPVGVIYDKRADRFYARCWNPFTQKRAYLGSFKYAKDAHEAWRIYKLGLAIQLAKEQTDPRVANALIYRYENYFN